MNDVRLRNNDGLGGQKAPPIIDVHTECIYDVLVVCNMHWQHFNELQSLFNKMKLRLKPIPSNLKDFDDLI